MSGSKLRPEHLAAVLSLTLDANLTGNLYHGWRVALVACAMAADLSRSERADLFYAALLHDIGAVALPKHITHYPQMFQQASNLLIKTHPEASAEMVRNTLGMESVACIIEAHHEWWNGEGYPNNLSGPAIPLASQYIRIADAADMAKCYKSAKQLTETLKQMNIHTGREWSGDVWSAFVHTFASGVLSKDIFENDKLPLLVIKLIEKLPAVSDADQDNFLDNLFTLFARIIDFKHPGCQRHCERVAEWTVTFGKALKLPEKDIRHLRHSACVHDAGKIAVPPALLVKPDALTGHELATIRSHAELTDKLLRSLDSSPALHKLADTAAKHHERFDGQGYPQGLAGIDIPLPARILAVADAYEAMTSDRSYREGVSPGIAMSRLMTNAATQFDSEVVKTIHSYYRENRSRFDNAWGAGALGAFE